MTTGYPRFPAINGDTIVFVAEDDLWRVSADGGVAQRLTAGLSAASRPAISPDGSQIAYIGAEEGPNEVHVVPADGGESRRLTYDSSNWCRVVGWTSDGAAVLYASMTGAAGIPDSRIRRVNVDGSGSEELPLGTATTVAFGADGVTVVAREYFSDQSHWKRYRGGTAGQLWIDATGDGEFNRLTNVDGNLACPQVIGDRVYFLSDHEGYGNVYSTTVTGEDLRRHTDHDDFYARGLSGDGTRLVYHSGGSLYLLDPVEDAPRKLNVHIGVTRTQMARRFVDTATYLQSADMTPDGSKLAITTRGKAFTFANWEGPVTQYGETDGVRYGLLTWNHDATKLFGTASDADPAERFIEFDAASGAVRRFDELDIGRIHELIASPVDGRVALANHRNQLIVVDTAAERPEATVIDSSDAGQISGVAFAPDGQWLAYAVPESLYEEDSPARATLKLAELSTGVTTSAVDRIMTDYGPAFDPEGKYLYFLGVRQLDPVYDSVHFDLNFPLGARPYALALRKDVPPPFVPQPAALVPAASTDASTNDEPEPTGPSIDVDGITTRVVPVPLGAAGYTQVLAAKGKLLVVSEPFEPGVQALDNHRKPMGSIDSVDLATGKVDRVADGVSWADVTADGQTLMYFSGDQARVVKATEKAPDTSEHSRESGWIDLTRVKVSVRPEREWPQMFREAWRLLGENFWVEDMAGVDWDKVYQRYAPLVARLATRGELSDLIWEMNGELGTSHVYERDGDYRSGPYFHQGFLGAEFTLDDEDGYRITKILRGDPGDPAAGSPLHRPGVDARVGDVVVAVNGQPVGAADPIAKRLVNQADAEVRLTLRRDGRTRDVAVKALASENALRYRDWVNTNRAAVSEATGGRVGYIHVPDMGTDGYAEFHRGYLNSFANDALIIDVRFNGGGHVSMLLLEKLARKRIGYSHSRWGKPSPYPRESPAGPMVALTNELAGSDGDIFCAGFKRMGLGPLVGTRTWGGVIGYFPWRPRLSDDTFLSQPEAAFHFDGEKWGVENYGVDPDIVVEYPPQDYVAGRDPQLAKAIEVALAELEAHPPHRPDLADRPRRTLPQLPPRPRG